MYATIQRHTAWSDYLRAAGRVCGALLFVAWIAYVFAEYLRPSFEVPAFTIFQALALAVVFAGYAIGWRHEVVGGITAIVGTFAYMALVFGESFVPPSPAMMWFAVPGVLYLAAWYTDHRRVHSPA